MERWRSLEPHGYPDVEVSSHGRVRRRGKPVAKSMDRGYQKVNIQNAMGEWKSKRVSALMLTAFVGPRPFGNVTRHLDDNKSNDVLSNLAWGTQQQNMDDKVKHGRHLANRAIGSKHGRTSLTEEQVISMRRLLALGVGVTELSRKFRCSTTTVYNIRNGKVWTHV